MNIHCGDNVLKWSFKFHFDALKHNIEADNLSWNLDIFQFVQWKPITKNAMDWKIDKRPDKHTDRHANTCARGAVRPKMIFNRNPYSIEFSYFLLNFQLWMESLWFQWRKTRILTSGSNFRFVDGNKMRCGYISSRSSKQKRVICQYAVYHTRTNID